MTAPAASAPSPELARRESEFSLADYLSGSMSEEAEHELELAALQDPAVFEALLAEEAELVDTLVKNPEAANSEHLYRLACDDQELSFRAGFAAALVGELDSRPVRTKVSNGVRVFGLVAFFFVAATVFAVIFSSNESTIARPHFLMGVLAWFMAFAATLLWVRANRNARERLRSALELAHRDLAGSGLDVGADASSVRDSGAS